MAAPTPVVPVAQAHTAAARPVALYVGDLHPEVTESTLWNHFLQIGPIQNVRLCRDVNTKRSLGYGYINFVNLTDAERAIDTKANMLIMNRPCRIMWSQRDPSLRRSGVGNLFVKNLAPTIDVQKLQNYFSVHGNILSCKVALDDKDSSKGFGFVHFETPESARSAVADMNGKVLEGQAVYVAAHVPKRQRGSPSDTKWTNVFVKNLPTDFDGDQVREVFSKFGEITSCFVRKHTFSKAEAGSDAVERVFAFVNFDSHENASAAVEAMNNNKIGESTVFVGRAQTKTERQSLLSREHNLTQAERNAVQSNLYIKNLEEGITKDVLEKFFSQFGTVASAKIATDPATGVSKGFGYLSFANAESAQKAVEDATGHAIPGFTKPLYVAFFEPKAARNARVTANLVARQQRMPYPPFYPNFFMPANRGPYPGQANQPRFPMAGPAQNAGGAPRGNRGPNQGPRTGPRTTGGAPPQQPAMQPRAGAQVPVPRAPNQLPAKDALKSFPAQEAVTAIGDYLFNSMQIAYPARTGKITGMLLSMYEEDLDGLIELVHDKSRLDNQITEANNILEEEQNKLDAEAKAASAQ